MRAPAKRLWLFAGLVCVAGVALIFAANKYSARAHRVLARIKHSVVDRFNSKGIAGNTLEIGGKKFKNVLGEAPYYLEVPPLDSVFFVTRESAAGTNMFHVLNLKNGEEVQIRTQADFGRNIGVAGAGFRDYVEQAGPGKIIAASGSSVGVNTKHVYHLNLETASMEAREIFQYDQHGNLTNYFKGPGF